MLMDLGAPSSLAGREAIERYCESTGLKRENLETVKHHKRFIFGPGKVYDLTRCYKNPVTLRADDGR